jgi:hypothetical protein
MKVYINELSIIGQAIDEDDAIDIIFNLAAVVSKTKDISCGKKAYRSKSLGDKFILKQSTIKEILIASSKRSQPKDERQRKLAIEVFLKQPFAENCHTENHHTITDDSGCCLKNSCFDAAASSIGSPLTISARGCPAYQSTTINIKSSIVGQQKIVLNVTNDQDLDALIWKFEHNPKHKTNQVTMCGEHISAMDLSKEDAKLALNNGIQINKKIYSYFNDHWYQFHCHHANFYHGFKIELEENRPEHMRALKIYSELESLQYGQIFEFNF